METFAVQIYENVKTKNLKTWYDDDWRSSYFPMIFGYEKSFYILQLFLFTTRIRTKWMNCTSYAATNFVVNPGI